MEEEYFIFVGRLDKQKGIHVLLKSWKLMGDNAPELLICGTGSMEDWCKEYIRENNLSTVEMKGFVPNIEARKLIANSKALILPTQWYEGFPMTIVEAYSVGTPVIGSDMGNVGSLIEDGVTGMKFKPCDSAKEICEVISKLMSCRFFAAQLMDTFNKKYSSNVNFKIMADIYLSIRGGL